jgi:hypothetical protein
MALDAVAVSVTTSATLIATADVDGSTFTISPVGGTVYLGGSGVTTAAGLPVGAGVGYSIDLGANEKIYGIGTATVDVRVLRHRQ